MFGDVWRCLEMFGGVFHDTVKPPNTAPPHASKVVTRGISPAI